MDGCVSLFILRKDIFFMRKCCILIIINFICFRKTLTWDLLLQSSSFIPLTSPSQLPNYLITRLHVICGFVWSTESSEKREEKGMYMSVRMERDINLKIGNKKETGWTSKEGHVCWWSCLFKYVNRGIHTF